MNHIKTYELNWFIGKNLREASSMIAVNNLPVELSPCLDIFGKVLCYVLIDLETYDQYDVYFGGFGEGHFDLPITNLILV